VTAASHLPRIVFLAVSAAAHLAAFGALHARAAHPMAVDDAAGAEIDTLPVDPPVEPEPPRMETPAPAMARSPAPPTPTARLRDHEPRTTEASPPLPAHQASGAPSAADARVAAPPVFAMTVRTGGAAAPSPSRDTVVAGSDRGAGGPFAESDVSSPARPLGSLNAAYPADARAQQIEGDVVMEIVVDASGVVTEARVVRRAGFGLDESALRAVRASRFTPAVRGGRPVAERMRYTVTFALR
jgi:protein TonB